MPEPLERRGLPQIEGYALPRGDELPAARVPWTLEPGRAALLVHDLQNYFVNAFPVGTAPISHVQSNVGMLRERCDALGIPVVYTAQPARQNPRERGLQADFWGPGMGWNASDVEIVESVVPAPNHAVLTKWRYSAFQRTTLEAMLAAQGRDQLIITGVFAHIGCLLTAAEAFMRDVQPFFVADAVADFSRECHDDAVRYVAGCCGRALIAAQVLEAL